MDETAKPAGAAPPTPPQADPAPADAPKRVIRTYASDMAMLQGQPAPAAQAIPKEQMHTPGTDTLAESVAKIPVPQAPPPPPEPPRPQLTPKEPSAPSSGGFLSGLFKREGSELHVTTLSSSTPSAWMSAGSHAAAPPPPAPPAEDVAPREAVLNRLRANVAPAAPLPPPPPPVFPSPKIEVAPAAPVQDDRLHTYKGDFATRVDTQQASAFSVLAAQSDAQPNQATIVAAPAQSSHALVYVLASAVLVVGGSLALYYAYQYMGESAPVPIVADAPTTLLTGDESFTLSGDGQTLMAALAAKADEESTIGTVRIAYLSISSSTPAGPITETYPGGAVVRAMHLHAPDILIRNITAESTVGVLRAGEESRVFFVLGTNSYERTFAGMLSWEATMGKDLATFYPALPDPVAAAPVVATMTATSTDATATSTDAVATTTAPSTAPLPTFTPGFVDAVVDSHDVRALRDAYGRTVLIYGYRDQNTLIIARDEAAFSILLARLSAS